MQPAAPSRLRKLLRFAVITTIVLAAAFAVRAYVPLPWFQHTVYTRSLSLPSGAHIEWHSGERISLRWRAVPSGTTQAWQPTPATITGKLFGPFTNDPLLTEVVEQQAPPPIHLLVATSALHTDDWASNSLTMIVSLPTTLTHGDYAFIGQSFADGSCVYCHGDEAVSFNLSIVAP